MSGWVAFAALRNAVRKPSASSLGSAPSKSYSVPMVVLATISPSEVSLAAELPIDDAIANQKYRGGKMMLLWQKRAMVNVVNDALQCVHASARIRRTWIPPVVVLYQSAG